MNIDRRGAPGVCAVLATLAFAGCTSVDAGFGSSVRTNIVVQTVEPEVNYAGPLASTDGQKAGAAVDRYRTDKVTQPRGIRTTNIGQSGAGGSAPDSAN
jgi:hypothetical protein